MRRELEAVLQSVHTIPISDLPLFLSELEHVKLAAFLRMLTPEPEAREDSLLTAEQAAKRLNCSPDFLYRNHQKLPFARQGKIGRKLLFSSSGIDQFLKQKSK